MSEPPAEEARTGTQLVAAAEVACRECREPIPAVARRCWRCGAGQRRRPFAGGILKAVSVAVALIGLVLGVHELTSTVVARLAGGVTLRQRHEVAGDLLARREYRDAWQVVEPLDDEATARLRCRIARHWLLDTNTLWDRMSLGESARLLAPVLAPLARTGPPRQRADNLALLAWAQLLRGTEERVELVAVDAIYRSALAEDETSVLANALYGHFLLSDVFDLGRGLEHLERAAEREPDHPDPSFSVRSLQYTGLSNCRLRGSSAIPDRASSDPGWPIRVAMVRFADTVRREDRWTPAREDVDDVTSRPGRRWSAMLGAWRLDTEPGLTALAGVLPPRAHLDLLDWLAANADLGEVAAPMAYVRALLLEELGDRPAAAGALRAAEPGPFLTEEFDALHRRLTGEHLVPLARRDRWRYRAEVLAAGEWSTAAYAEILEEVDSGVRAHRLGRRGLGPPLLPVVAGGRRALAEQRDAGTTAPAALEIERRLASYEAELTLAEGGAAVARATLARLVAELPAGHAIRGRTLIELAAASLAVDDAAAAEAVALLREAVESEGWLDWAWIRWRPAFAALHARADFAAFLADHGRRVGGPAPEEAGDGR